MDDPYVYPGTDVLKNLANIQDKNLLRSFEIEWTTQRLSEGCPAVPMTSDGYCALHRHIFQDVYPWAGQLRTVELAKENAMFCRPQFIAPQLAHRFDILASQSNLTKVPAALFAIMAAEHISELNVIHPFREGNGRTNRAFLQALGKQAGHLIYLENISPADWMAASRESFQTADVSRFEKLILGALKPR